MATVSWEVQRRAGMTPEERLAERKRGFLRQAKDVMRREDRLLAARDSVMRGEPLVNMPSARRADMAAEALGLSGEGPEADARRDYVLRLYDIVGADASDLDADRAEAVNGVKAGAMEQLKRAGLPSTAQELRTVAEGFLGPESGWGRYSSDPRLKSLLTGWNVFGLDGGYVRRAPGLSTRPVMDGVDLPVSGLERGIRTLPGPAQTALRAPLRAARLTAAGAAGLARYPLRAASWLADADLSGELDRTVRRWSEEDAADALVDARENREYQAARRNGTLGWSYGNHPALHSPESEVASETAEQLMFLAAASRLYGKYIPEAFGANSGMDMYDMAARNGMKKGPAAALGAAYGFLDAGLWGLPAVGVAERLAGRGLGRLAHVGETYGKMALSQRLGERAAAAAVPPPVSAAEPAPAPSYAGERRSLETDAYDILARTGDYDRANGFLQRGMRRLDVAAELERQWRSEREKELQMTIRDYRRDADRALSAGTVLPDDRGAAHALEELRYLRTHQDAKGGRATRAASGGGMTVEEMTAPEYLRVDLGRLPDARALASVHREDLTPTVTVRGTVLPEGYGDENFPYDFSMPTEFSPEGVPWSSLDPGEVNSNAFAHGDGQAVTTARGDYFALTENEQRAFDRLTKEGVNPRDERVRRLRAMKEAGDRSVDEVKRLAWAERKNRDIELAYRLGGENWRDYYVATTAGMLGGDRLREEIAGDVNARADHLRGHYERMAAAGRTRDAEAAMDRLQAFRKRAQYLAARYGLHPELARLDRDRTLWETLKGGQRGQRLSVAGEYPQSLYVETGHYGTEPSRYARAAQALADRFGPQVRFDPTLSDTAGDAEAYADEYRRDVDAYSFWNMPYAPDESLNSRYSLPVFDGETEAPPWLQRAVRRRRKLTRAKPAHGDLEGGETSEGEPNGDGAAVDHNADLEDFKAEEAKDPDVEAWIDKASGAREDGGEEAKAQDPGVAAWVDKVSADREREARGAQDRSRQVGPATSGDAARTGLQMKQVGPAMSGEAAKAVLQMKQVGPAMSGDAATGLQMKQIGPDMGGGGAGGLAERRASADVYQERIEAAGLTGKEAARALRDMVYSGNTDRLDRAEEARRKAAGEQEPGEKEPLPGIRPKRRRRG